MTNEQKKKLIEDAEHVLELKKNENNEYMANNFKWQLYGMQDALRVLGYDLKINHGSCKAEIIEIDN